MHHHFTDTKDVFNAKLNVGKNYERYITEILTGIGWADTITEHPMQDPRGDLHVHGINSPIHNANIEVKNDRMLCPKCYDCLIRENRHCVYHGKYRMTPNIFVETTQPYKNAPRGGIYAVPDADLYVIGNARLILFFPVTTLVNHDPGELHYKQNKKTWSAKGFILCSRYIEENNLYRYKMIVGPKTVTIHAPDATIEREHNMTTVHALKNLQERMTL